MAIVTFLAVNKAQEIENVAIESFTKSILKNFSGCLLLSLTLVYPPF